MYRLILLIVVMLMIFGTIGCSSEELHMHKITGSKTISGFTVPILKSRDDNLVT